jgi:hypothetical protein
MEIIKEKVGTVYGTGYFGEGTYKSRQNGKRTRQYKTWLAMLERCYENKTKEKLPSYAGCYVCEEWHNFQIFSKWYDENYYEIDGQRMELDKDILVKGNKVYSPETCVFVPHRINSLFTKSNSIRGDLPIGVHWHKRDEKYVAKCQCGDKRKHLGYHDTPEKAFNAYKIFKENYIKQIAEEYKDRIPNKLYDAMKKYIVEITD